MPDFLTNDTFWGALSAVAAVVAALAAMGFFRKEQIVRGELYTTQAERDDLRKKLARAEVRLARVDPERFLDRIDGLEGDFKALEAEALGYTERQSEAFGRAAAIMAEQRLWDSDAHGAGMAEEALRFAQIGLAADPGSTRLKELTGLIERRAAALRHGEPIETLNWDGMSDVELNKLAIRLDQDGTYILAEMAARRSVPLAIQRTGLQSANASAAIGQHASALERVGRFEEAEPLFRKALAISREVQGEQHPDTAARLHNLAGLLLLMHQYEEAEQMLQEALAILVENRDKRHPEYATALTSYAILLRRTERVEEAGAMFEEALQGAGKALGQKTPGYATILAHYASFLDATGRRDQAITLYSEVLSIREAELGPDHPDTVGTRARLERLRVTPS